jgi:hypothetical protein
MDRIDKEEYIVKLANTIAKEKIRAGKYFSPREVAREAADLVDNIEELMGVEEQKSPDNGYTKGTTVTVSGYFDPNNPFNTVGTYISPIIKTKIDESV